MDNKEQVWMIVNCSERQCTNLIDIEILSLHKSSEKANLFLKYLSNKYKEKTLKIIIWNILEDIEKAMRKEK